MTSNPSAKPATAAALAPLVLAAMIVLAALSRLLPHPPNFSPVEAMALFGGAWYASRRVALLVPLAAMLASDLALAWVHGGQYLDYFTSADFWLVYLAIAACTALGFGLRGRVRAPRVLGFALAGSLLFFMITNFGAWLADIGSAHSIYAANLSGLAAAYVAGIPFFQNTVAGSLFFSAVLFGGFELLRRYVPALRAQPA
ncbi:MAG: DUF6580 family putative transport protein [Xanthomonadaceae bacterium]|nr:DUF6580 family putative transport protein [Xanthomonadaceae bacterium]